MKCGLFILALLPVLLVGSLLIYEYVTNRFLLFNSCNYVSKEAQKEPENNDEEACGFADVSKENFTIKMNEDILRYYMNSSNAPEVNYNRIAFDGTDIKMEDCEFLLYTRHLSDKGVQIHVNSSQNVLKTGFDPGKPLILATHGYLSGADENWMIELVKAQLTYEDCNFITLDWSYCSKSLFYLNAVECVEIVGKYLSEFLNFLIENTGINPDQIHLMGHSLGAHLVGQVSRYGHKVYRISGFDPAGPAISKNDLKARLDPEDAEIVDIIHTNTFMFGYKEDLGHYDFYPNGGKKQPGCFLLDYVCRHSMSYFYYIDSLYESHKYRASKCSSVKDASKGNCSGVTHYMGVLADVGKPGIYYLKVSTPISREFFNSCEEQPNAV